MEQFLRHRRSITQRSLTGHDQSGDAWVLAFVCLFWLCRAVSIVVLADTVRTGIPVVATVFLVLCYASLMLICLQRPWACTPWPSWSNIIYDSSLFLLGTVFWFEGLRLSGAMSAVLLGDAELCFLVVASAFGYSPALLSTSQWKGLVLVTLAYAIVVSTCIGHQTQPGGYWFWISTPVAIELNGGEDVVASGLEHAVPPEHGAAAETMIQLWLLIKAAVLALGSNGAALILMGAIIQATRSAARLSDSRCAESISCTISAAVLAPFVLFGCYHTPPELPVDFTCLPLLSLTPPLSASFVVVAYSYMTTFLEARFDRAMRVRTTLLVSTATVGLIQLFLHGDSSHLVEDSFVYGCSFLVLLLGLQLIFRDNDHENVDEDSESFNACCTRACTVLELLFASAEDQRLLGLATTVCAVAAALVVHGVFTNCLLLATSAFCLLLDMARRMLTICCGISAGWGTDAVHTFGYARYSVLALFIETLVSFFFSFTILVESFGRWAAPAAIEPAAFYGCCVLGLAKLSCLAPYYKQDRTSLGPGMALGHAVLEMLGTIVLLVTGTAVYDRWSSAPSWDTYSALILSAASFMTLLPSGREIFDVLLQRVPRGLEPELVACFQQLHSIDGIVALSEPHFWSQGMKAFHGTLFIRVADGCDIQKVLCESHRIIRQCALLSDMTVEVSKESFYPDYMQYDLPRPRGLPD